MRSYRAARDYYGILVQQLNDALTRAERDAARKLRMALFLADAKEVYFGELHRHNQDERLSDDEYQEELAAFDDYDEDEFRAFMLERHRDRPEPPTHTIAEGRTMGTD